MERRDIERQEEVWKGKRVGIFMIYTESAVRCFCFFIFAKKGGGGWGGGGGGVEGNLGE